MPTNRAIRHSRPYLLPQLESAQVRRANTAVRNQGRRGEKTRELGAGILEQLRSRNRQTMASAENEHKHSSRGHTATAGPQRPGTCRPRISLRTTVKTQVASYVYEASSCACVDSTGAERGAGLRLQLCMASNFRHRTRQPLGLRIGCRRCRPVDGVTCCRSFIFYEGWPRVSDTVLLTVGRQAFPVLFL